MAVIDKLKELRIKATLMADQTVGLMEIEAEVLGSQAVLRGEVENDEQRRIAEELAHRVEGVQSVRNEIRVAAPGAKPRKNSAGVGMVGGMRFVKQFADAEIESELRKRLAAQREVDVSRVDFTSLKEIVHLSGVVGSQEELRRLQNMVLDVREVTGICSDIVAQG